MEDLNLTRIPNLGLRLPRLRKTLRARNVARLQIIYCVWEGQPFATLSVIPQKRQSDRIVLSRSLTKTIKLFFGRRMANTCPSWREGPDVAGILTWDLKADAWSHQHFGYQQRFFLQVHRITPSRFDSGRS
jgi:hypothetical protein